MMMMMMMSTYGFVSRNSGQNNYTNQVFESQMLTKVYLGFTLNHQQTSSFDFRTRLKRPPNVKKSVITQDSKLTVDFSYSNEKPLLLKIRAFLSLLYVGSRFQGLFLVESAFSLSS